MDRQHMHSHTDVDVAHKHTILIISRVTILIGNASEYSGKYKRGTREVQEKRERRRVTYRGRTAALGKVPGT